MTIREKFQNTHSHFCNFGVVGVQRARVWIREQIEQIVRMMHSAFERILGRVFAISVPRVLPEIVKRVHVREVRGFNVYLGLFQRLGFDVRVADDLKFIIDQFLCYFHVISMIVYVGDRRSHICESQVVLAEQFPEIHFVEHVDYDICLVVYSCGYKIILNRF